MNRPTPRKSTLSGQTPAAPATASSGPAQLAEATPTANTPQATTVTKPKNPPKVSFYQDPADTARLRAAFAHTHATEGYRSMSDMIDRAVMAEVARLENQYNGGRPWPPVSARNIPQGRPVGE